MYAFFRSSTVKEKLQIPHIPCTITLYLPKCKELFSPAGKKKLLTLRPHTFLFFYGKQQLLRSQEVIIIFTEKSFDIESTGYLEISSTGWSKITFCETFLMNLTRPSFKLAFLYLSINVHGCENFEPLFELVICSFSSSDKDCKNSPGTGHKLLTVNHITIWIDQHTRHQTQKTQFK